MEEDVHDAGVQEARERESRHEDLRHGRLTTTCRSALAAVSIYYTSRFNVYRGMI